MLLRSFAPILAAAIWILSSQSTLPTVKGIFGFDKFQHLLAYAALAAAVGFWFPGNQWKNHPLRTFIFTALIASAYGAADEIHQYFVPGRSCSVWDWLADTLGAALGAGAFWVVIRRVMKVAAGGNPPASHDEVSS
ncbi:VanZ family protein [Breznakiella homolactica]|uniref:VanZ family protein n=1 Tax=Breznakiella homolactica TaxID=2798577 RepID=A0A7T7XRU7_9SPIR|nr:VanZ family protein [Breznakiella homolactica]